MQFEEDKSLQKLREIFLDDTNLRQSQFENEIKELRFQLTDKNAKIESNYPIITDLLRKKIAESEDEVANALSPVISKALKKQISESKDEIIDSLYPIMGQTIKKYVSEAVKDLFNSINQKIDNALRTGIFSKKIKSKISGVSASDIILQESFPFSVNEVFLIHEKSGILITHVSESIDSSSDGDLISGMLTAIKDFVSDSFKTEKGEEDLYEIQYGDSKIILERGLHSYLAVVVKGNEPVNFDEELANLNNVIHDKYSKSLREFEGEFDNLEGIDLPIEKFVKNFNQVKSEEKHTEQNLKPRPILLYLLGALFLLLLIIFGAIKIIDYVNTQHIDKLVTQKLSSVSELNLENIDWEVDNDNLTLSGFVNSFAIRNKLDSVFQNSAGIDNFTNNVEVHIPPSNQKLILDEAEKLLSKLNLKNVSVEVSGDKIIIDGNVESLKEKREIGFHFSQIKGVQLIENNLQYFRKFELTDEVAKEKLLNMRLDFDFAETKVTQEHMADVNLITPYLIKNNVQLQINSYPDTTGNKELNLIYSQNRAENIAAYLVSQNVSKDNLQIKNYSVEEAYKLKCRRRVAFSINQ